ncbi:hypothetical protein G6F46_000796 [Rhizopus delemar]|uniref:Uncharacterized protein n=3 Tax=Rhizopus TaxID=4842 RepID=I1CIM5_RHIO9|nr:hypothetical protein RO3G_13016 [Rhizopus delemar RA 99-880]KAG1055273.1 hypothetical protein G6F43_002756 [Rhizopus delemar]KAG1551020.1 hypothetical protein G6F51_002102 [Rhizopus arrhizus]KAG1464369.1 hypothetical protein G6F55_001827 [Rhizopus delemar]KAG1502547.1 hypothetical protein G6F54_002280 [Rhizopus delemar]|eukprot:EIE88305.1 hypothetical protein RO3G_13016 [Rhizopus delemar RA 99-880]
MHPLVHSPTQTTIKSKWYNPKTWFTPEFTKRRPSHCSTTSTTSSNSYCCCQTKEEVYPKRPSLTGSESLHVVVDKCMSPFRRRPSCASSVATFDIELETKKVMEAYQFALDELNYAQDSRGSLYYSGDRVAAKEAIEQCDEAYAFLLEQCTPQQESELKSSLGQQLVELMSQFDSLPLQDDQLSF